MIAAVVRFRPVTIIVATAAPHPAGSYVPVGEAESSVGGGSFRGGEEALVQLAGDGGLTSAVPAPP